VQAVKSLPYTERRYDGSRKVWFIDPRYGSKLTSWIEIYAGEVVSLPFVTAQYKPVPVMRMAEVRYVGTCKNRDDGSSVAFGLVGKDWQLIFPETVLRSWFDSGEPEESPAEQTLYQVLGIKKSATTEEIKTAFRRLAKQWHPDVCKEQNAQEMFIKIQEASLILSDTFKRAKYDAGLVLQSAFEAQIERQNTRAQYFQASNGYRTPLRCGLMMIEGIEKLGRIEVTKILAWEDIVKNGKTLVVSWPMGGKEPIEAWV
jgi:hypothetical protein